MAPPTGRRSTLLTEPALVWVDQTWYGGGSQEPERLNEADATPVWLRTPEIKQARAATNAADVVRDEAAALQEAEAGLARAKSIQEKHASDLKAAALKIASGGADAESKWKRLPKVTEVSERDALAVHQARLDRAIKMLAEAQRDLALAQRTRDYALADHARFVIDLSRSTIADEERALSSTIPRKPDGSL
jgi:hypothetical protein